MIAIVYSGSRNAYWKIISGGKIVDEATTPGLNPLFNDQKDLIQIFNKQNVLINRAEEIKKIQMFAAGASTIEKREELKTALCSFFKNSKSEVYDDLYGAALSACFNERGIVGILGSGSNCAYFNGKNLDINNFGLGYILGDEGSANHLGRKLIKNYLEGKLPENLREKFNTKYNTDRPGILEKIYRKPGAQAYLTSYFDFFIENRENTFIKSMIDNSFDTYFKTYLIPTLQANPEHPVHFVGSVAGTFPDRLRQVAKKHGITITSITKEPVYNLINYYSTKN